MGERIDQRLSYTGLNRLDHGQIEEQTFLLDTNRKSFATSCFEKLIVVLVIAAAAVVLFVLFRGSAIDREKAHSGKGNNVISAKCADNEVCSNAGLVGLCCPTKKGDYLGCCASSEAACASVRKCALLGIQGNCCPTDDGTYLNCCS
eukprot:TRINITY_DN6214_c0_g1_i1.p1 TRINITY_DN6214_c0_g1~~TRINITY_DN6214_c0_g1_i1.p1  ORF type:complete len:147 (+),score=12.11 TRINITY_DN6214_c0_g1_i1:166-606(+)